MFNTQIPRAQVLCLLEEGSMDSIEYIDSQGRVINHFLNMPETLVVYTMFVFNDSQ